MAEPASVTNIHALPAITPGDRRAARAAEVATAFEATLVAELLRPIATSGTEGGLLGMDHPLGDQLLGIYAGLIVERGGLGLADGIRGQIERLAEKA